MAWYVTFLRQFGMNIATFGMLSGAMFLGSHVEGSPVDAKADWTASSSDLAWVIPFTNLESTASKEIDDRGSGR